MRTKRINYALALVLVLVSMAGCASRPPVINIDGMPISSHEYRLEHYETGIQAVFVLTQYFRDYEGEEYIVKPIYLDTLAENKLTAKHIERLVLHVKVVNMNKKKYSIKWGVKEPDGSGFESLLYHGKISRRDFPLVLPFEKEGDYGYLFQVLGAEGEDLFELPIMRYKVKGGIKVK